MSNTNYEIKFAVGFIAGMAAGLAIAFLFAPQSGEETRKVLKEKVTDAGDKVRDVVEDVSAQVKEVVGDRKKIYTEAWKQPKIKPYTEEL